MLAKNIESQNQSPESSGMEIVNNTAESNDIKQLRSNVGIIGDRSFQNGFISRESYDFLKGLSTDPNIEQTLESMSKSQYAPAGGKIAVIKDIIKHAKEHHDKAEMIDVLFRDAIRSKHATEKDRQFLMEQIVHGHEFVTKFSEAQDLIKGKIERMKKAKEGYNNIVNNPLCENGVIQVDKNTKLQIPDEKKFLAMTSKERREFVKKAEEALKKAKEHAEKTGDIESSEIGKQYSAKLDHFEKEEKIIGKHTRKEFEKWFTNQKLDMKKDALAELHDGQGGQMERYKKLWGQVRGNLEGDELKHMESLRDKMGYTELFTEFGKMGKRLDDKYETELNKYAQKGQITPETKRRFMEASDGMKNQSDLKTKYHYLKELPSQLREHIKLQEEINKSPNKVREYFKLHGEWSHGKRRDVFDKYKETGKLPNDQDEARRQSKDPLGAITSGTTRAAIMETNLALKKRGKEKQVTFLRRIKKMFIKENQDNFDATGFQSNLRKGREDLKEKVQNQPLEAKKSSGDNIINLQEKLRKSRVKEIRLGGEKIDESGIEDEMKVAEITGAKVVEDQGFKQVEFEESGHTARKTQIQINREKSMDRFFSEDNKHQYRGKTEGGSDALSLAVHAQDGRTVELNLTEIRAMEKYMEEDLQKVNEGEDLEKAA